jgi:calcineurin-like phosphoesterase family protein
MNEALILGWNSVVGEEDVVYHLGDVSLTSASKTSEILNRLNGTIHLILGNHEKSVMRKEGNRNRFESIRNGDTIRVNGVDIYLHHYACRVWNESHRGAYHLYGHSHDSLEYEQWGKSMDVGVDSAYKILGEYRPFSFDEIHRILSKREVHEVDHHVANR